jgi:two-component system, OmpR family, phosphate regulon response regulator PhoB
MRILIADDSATMRKLLAARLEADGYEVVQAADGEQALSLVRSGRPDLLILDNTMPKLDGFGVVRALREDPATSAVPIVMLTGHTGEDDRADSIQLGVDEYIPKPFSLGEVSARVRRTLQRAGH